MAQPQFDWKGASLGDKEEIERIVEKYYRLGYDIALRWVKNGAIEKDTALGLAEIALMKCIRKGTYNPEKSKFTTYFAQAVNNEVRMFLRKENKHSRMEELDKPIRFTSESGDNAVVTIGDLQVAEEGDPVEQIEDELMLEEALDIFNTVASKYMNTYEALCVKYWFTTDLSQNEIAVTLGISQSYVSRLIRSGIDKMRREAKRRER